MVHNSTWKFVQFVSHTDDTTLAKDSDLDTDVYY